MIRPLLMLVALFCCLSMSAFAQLATPETPLRDAAQEQRARQLFRELRCEVCAGQSIGDSNAALAQDMRGLVRGKVAAGESDEAILGYFAERYGEGILMRPPMQASTAPLWLGPAFVFLLGGWFLIRYFARKKQSHF